MGATGLLDILQWWLRPTVLNPRNGKDEYPQVGWLGLTVLSAQIGYIVPQRKIKDC